ncbi:MAG: PAS domain S-box protein [Polyangiaceae bacterium]|nr:PAS domain S-box protein [Polyangiaceae bacterium]MCB9605523.1 PAS domain S-box protein [Polyangiaceae bacterium]
MQQWFRDLVNPTGAPTLLLEAETVIAATPAALKLLDCDEAAVVGLSLEEFSGPDEHPVQTRDGAVRRGAFSTHSIPSSPQHRLLVLAPPPAPPDLPLASALDAIVDYALLTLDPEGHVASWNAGATALKGYTREEATGLHLSAFYTPEDIAARKPDLELTEATQKGRYEDEGWRVRKDGSRFWANVTITPVLEAATLIGYCKVTRDLTARHEAEERFQAAVEASPTGMVMVDLDGRILLANARLEQLFGYCRADLLGKSIDDLVPDRFRAGHAEHRARFSEESGSRSMGVGRDLYGLRADGSEFPVEIGLNPINTTRGRCVMASVVDITERQRAADELRRSNVELEHFAAVASHDLQEPLRMVSSFVELLGQRYGDQLDEKANRYIYFAVDGAKRMQHLVNDLLEYSRAGATTRPLRPVALGPIIANVQRVLRAVIVSKRATVRVDEFPTILGDEPQLQRVFQNLLSNALKFSDPARAPEIRIEVEGDASWWTIRVVDNGVGFSMDSAEAIFQMFHRLPATEVQGSGIGLATVRRIMERHGGQIQAESKPGEGATFILTFPNAQLEDRAHD